MQMYDNLANADSTYGGCCTIDDLADARRVAWKLDIPHFTLNLESGFHEKVIAPFVQSYLSGTTPSPCVLCNTHVKFDLFHQQGAGHRRGEDRHRPLRAHHARRRRPFRAAQGARSGEGPVVLPLRADAGAVVRGAVPARRADEAGGARHRGRGRALRGAQEGVVRDLLRAAEGWLRLDRRARGGITPGEGAGEIVDVDGNVVGQHDGYYHFTIGQRRGIDIGGTAERMYVVDVNPFTKRVTIGPASALERDELIAERVHWIGGAPSGPVEVQARVRSRMPDVAATITPLDGGRARVVFAQKLRASRRDRRSCSTTAISVSAAAGSRAERDTTRTACSTNPTAARAALR
jgi:tRNA-specific 2-thiouridylase